jgi:hypothetical protein
VNALTKRITTDPSCLKWFQDATSKQYFSNYLANLLKGKEMQVADSIVEGDFIEGTVGDVADVGFIINWNSQFKTATLNDRILFILHEMGHVLKAEGILPDGPGVLGNGPKNDQQVLDHCSKTVNGK